MKIIDPFYNTYSEFIECIKNKFIAVISVGSTEYHDKYLPLSVDTLIADKLVEKAITSIHCRVPENTNVCILKLPPLWIGYSLEWIDYQGTLSISPILLYNILASIYNSLARIESFKGLLIVNGHGGNYSVLEIFAREYTWRFNGRIAIVDIWKVAKELGIEFCHACTIEVELARKLGIRVLDRGSQLKHMLSKSKVSIIYSRDASKPGIMGEIVDQEEIINKLINRVAEEILNAIKILAKE